MRIGARYTYNVYHACHENSLAFFRIKIVERISTSFFLDFTARFLSESRIVIISRYYRSRRSVCRLVFGLRHIAPVRAAPRDSERCTRESLSSPASSSSDYSPARFIVRGRLNARRAFHRGKPRVFSTVRVRVPLTRQEDTRGI